MTDGTEPFSPWLMRTAWRRTVHHLRREEILDFSELLMTKASPLEVHYQIASDLSANQYRPDPLRMVPHPKKGHRIRHYSVPSIRDQTATMAMASLLAPLLESNFVSASFGNRIFRSQGRRASDGDGWRLLPFSLSDDKFYAGFSETYGLFRQVAHDLVRQVVRRNAKDSAKKYSLTGVALERIPWLTDEDWRREWCKGENDDGHVYWARLDLSLAYPSVNRRQLKVDLSEQARNVSNHPPNGPGASLDTTRLDGLSHPWADLAPAFLTTLAEQLGRIISQMEYTSWSRPGAWDNSPLISDPVSPTLQVSDGSVWKGDSEHLSAIGAGESFCEGIPTGLGISGWLMNVALHRVDEQMVALCQRAKADGHSVAYLRYADDFLLLGRSPQAVLHAVDALSDSLEASGHNFHLNTDKSKPEGISDRNKSQEERCNLLNSIVITSGSEERFITEIVREMSGDGDADTDWLQGPTNRRSLERLLLLGTLEHDDEEVPLDARIGFALGGLAYRPWPLVAPNEGNEPQPSIEAVRRIMAVTEMATRMHPWRFRSWRHAAIVAVRAADVPGLDEPTGTAWLMSLARTIRWRSLETIDLPRLTVDGSDWYSDNAIAEGSPAQALQRLEEAARDVVGRQAIRRGRVSALLRLSFHRSCLLNALADAARDLSNPVGEGPTWTRHVSQASHEPLRTGLENFRCVFENLYADFREGAFPSGWWWERQAMARYLLAIAMRQGVYKDLPSPAPNALISLDARTVEICLLNVPLDLHPRVKDILKGDAIHKPDGRSPSLPPELWAAIAGCVNSSETRSRRQWSVDEAVALARSGVWKLLPFQLVPRRNNLQPVTAEHRDRIWSRVIRFNRYVWIRRLLHGIDDPMGFAPLLHLTGLEDLVIFGSAPVEASNIAPLRETIHCFEDASQRNPSLHTAVPFPPHIALSYVEAVYDWSTEKQGVPLWTCAPEFVGISRGQADQVIESRHHQTKSSQTNETPSWPDSVKVVEPVAAQEACHPAFLVPSIFFSTDVPHGDHLQWNCTALHLYLATGGENAMDTLLRHAPWRPPHEFGRRLTSEYLIDPSSPWFASTLAHVREYYGWEMTLVKDSGAVVARIDPFPPSQLKKKRRQQDVHCVLAQPTSAVPPKFIIERIAANPLCQGWTVPQALLVKLEHEASEMLAALTFRTESSHDFSTIEHAATLPDRTGEAPDVVVFPENYFDVRHIRALRAFVARTGIALIGGNGLRELPRAAAGHPGLRLPYKRVLLNSGVAVIPERRVRSSFKSGDRTRTLVFPVPKREPSIYELGILRALNVITKKDTIEYSWFRDDRISLMTDAYWGPWSAAICSDVLSPAGWEELRGRILHFFLLAFNPAVDLFDRFAYTRAYEVYANFLTSNHGKHGGSLAWTPRRKDHEAELFRVHGKGQRLLADVVVPVTELERQQRRGLDEAIARKAKELTGPKNNKPTWLPPPPGYQQEP